MMMGRESMDAPGAVGQPLFATTHWSVVLAAGQGDTSQSAAALEQLCRTYWYPLYCYTRRRGYTHEDAQDLTQGFLLQLLERQSLARVDASKGRFRSFLLASLNYFICDEYDRATAKKRGAGQLTLSFLDGAAADERYRREPVDDQSPDRLFERRWALALLDQVLARLEKEFREAEKNEQFLRMRSFLVGGSGEEGYAPAAAELAMSVEAFKKAVHRMRYRYYELFREEIANTVSDPAEVEDEMRYLCGVVAG